MTQLKESARKRLKSMATTDLSDALDSINIRGAVSGISPVFGPTKVAGRAKTVKITAAGPTKSKHHIGSRAIDAAEEGNVIVIDNGGDEENSCWGGLLSFAAKQKGVSGVVVDGAARDAEEYDDLDFPVHTRAIVPRTARGRVMEENYDCLIRVGGVQVSPGDVIMADANGVAVVPFDKLTEVLEIAEENLEKEESMREDLKDGMSILEVDEKYRYEKMLEKED